MCMRGLRAGLLTLTCLGSGLAGLGPGAAHAEAGAAPVIVNPEGPGAAASDGIADGRATDRTFREALDTAQWASGRRKPKAVPAGQASAPTAGTVNAAPSAPPSPSLFAFSDTQISYRFQGPAAEPGVGVARPTGGPVARTDGREIPKNVLNIFHTDSWAYGTNLFSLDILQSGSQDPAGNQFRTFTNAVGATELYFLYRGVLSGNKIFNTNAFSIPGVIKDVGLAFGADINTKNTRFDSEKRAGTFGLNFAIDVPVGFLNLKVQAYKEFARNGFGGLGPVAGFDYSHFRSVEYKMTPEFEIAYTFPLTFTGLPLALAGFNNIILPKGKYGTLNQNETQIEFLSRTNLVLDVGKLLYNQANRFDVFVGFQYWLNKFGNDPLRTINTEEKALIAGVAFHLN